jgi:hypothetical protein
MTEWTVPCKYRYNPVHMSPRQPHRLEIRFSEEEWATLKRLATEQGLKQLATYIHWLLAKEARSSPKHD